MMKTIITVPENFISSPVLTILDEVNISKVLSFNTSLLEVCIKVMKQNLQDRCVGKKIFREKMITVPMS